MLNIETSGVTAQQGSPPRPVKSEDIAPAQLAKAPPTQTEVPERAVTPTQESERSQSVRSQKEEAAALVDSLNKQAERSNSLASTQVRFAVDKRSDELVVSIIDQKTDEVIRQIPAEDALERSADRDDQLKGLLLNATG